MNFIFISPNFPSIYSHFIKSLKDRGVTVLGIGDAPYDTLNSECKENLTEYCFCSDLGNLQWMKNTVDYLKSKYGKVPSDYMVTLNKGTEFERDLLTLEGYNALRKNIGQDAIAVFQRSGVPIQSVFSFLRDLPA